MKLRKDLFVLGISFLLLTPALAQTESTTELETIRVTGMQAEELSQPTAPKRISKEALEEAHVTDVGRALRQAPGVYVRDEEGQGLRPNIGLRGTNPDRSKKVVILLDEILIGPAPYAAPAAYYTPSVNLAEQLEIYKGFSALMYGPNSVGGMVNYISRPIPNENLSSVDLSAGSYSSMNLKLLTGGKTSWGGYLLEGSQVSSAGFKQLDGGGDTGFVRQDLAGRFQWNLPEVEGRLQYMELRLGLGHEDSDETYLGLSEADFSANPYRRYKASALDHMKWDHQSAILEYNRQLGASGLWKMSVYRHNFHRDWNRFDRFGNSAISVKSVLLDPVGTDALYLDVLRGEQDSSAVGGTLGQIILAGNDRSFISQGLQSLLMADVEAAGVAHQFKFIARLHQDQIDRNHTSDTYEMLSGAMQPVRLNEAYQLNQEWAFAKTLALQDDLRWGDWVFTLMGRGELIDFRFRDKLAGTEKSRSDAFFVPGAGALYQVSANLSVKFAVNRAATATGLDAGGGERREESLNKELGLKYLNDERTAEADLVLFENDYDNITGTCTASNSCQSANLDQQLNGGRAKIQGLEARMGYSFRALKSWWPVQLNATLLRARFNNDFSSSNGEWGYGDVLSGDPLPYIPEVQYSLSLGQESGRFRQSLNILYQGSMADQSVEAGRRSIPGYSVVDWNALYSWSSTWQFFAKVENVLNRSYLVAYRPFGARPGKPQTAMIGFKASF